jgi:hypothetical protein
MRRPPLYHLSLALLSLSLIGAGLTDLDYNLGKSKYGSSSISDDESFHGSSSALLSVDEDGSYIRISVYLDEPLPLDDLDRLSMWIAPELGDGAAQIDLFLDGDGDGSYDSHSALDARLRSLRESWSEMGMISQEWNELDGFDLAYEEYGEDSGSQSLDVYSERLGKLSVVRLYITLYKDENVPKTSAYFDYIKVGDQILSFEPLEREEIKDGTKSVSPGGTVTYVITYGNNLLEPVDLVVSESYDPRTAFIQASPPPDPGTNNVWTIHNLPPGKHGQIVVKVRASKPTCKADLRGEVSGAGYTSVSGMLSTDFEGYQISNTVTLSSDKFNLTSTATTAVRSIEGSIINYNDHGSGFYSSRDQLVYSPTRISAFRDVNAVGSITSVNISATNISDRSVLFRGDLRARSLCENKMRDLLWKESYSGDVLNISRRAQLSKTNSFFETSAGFSGTADCHFKWNEGISSSQLAGNLSFNRRATVKYYSRRSSQADDGLGCCQEAEELTEQ